MSHYRIIDKPAFEVMGEKTWISGQDNDLFRLFWVQCREGGLFEAFEHIRGDQTGKITNSTVLGISCVENDPNQRSFIYLIAIEKPETCATDVPEIQKLAFYHVPAAKWAVFECVGKVPQSIMETEMFAFLEWLPSSGYEHAKAPEMEVYFPGNDGLSVDNYCEFWLPLTE